MALSFSHHKSLESRLSSASRRNNHHDHPVTQSIFISPDARLSQPSRQVSLCAGWPPAVCMRHQFQEDNADEMLRLFRAAGNACPFAPKTNVCNVYTAFWSVSQTSTCRALTSQSAVSQQPSPTQLSPTQLSPTQLSRLPSQSLPSQPPPSQPPPPQAPLVKYIPQRRWQRWSAEESDTFSKLYKSGKADHEIAARLKRSWSSVRNRANKLRNRGDIAYRSSGPGTPFTPEEDARLLSARQQKLKWTRICEEFPHRHMETLVKRVRKLSGRMPQQPTKPSRKIRFSNDDDARILHLRRHEGLSIPQIALLMSRATSSVEARLSSLREVPNPPFSTTVAREYDELKRSGNLPANFYSSVGRSRSWTPQEVSQLCKLSAIGTSKQEIAAVLGRTTSAIGVAIQRFVFREKDGKHVPRAWTQEETSRLLIMTAKGADDAEIARALSRSKQAVYEKRKRLLAGKLKSKNATGVS